jgi:small subunit ribosomal protein S1
MDEIEAEVVHVSQEDKRIGLSIRKVEEHPGRDTSKAYMNQQKKATSNLGELLREKMMNAQSQPPLEGEESRVMESAESESGAPVESTDTES